MSQYYDYWENVISKNGFPADELISALQKSIRRGWEENALSVAYEMYMTSPDFEDYMWKRLMVISVEDIGFGDTHAPIFIKTLNDMRREFEPSAVDRALFFVHAIRYLCKAEKERSSDLHVNIVKKEFELIARRPEIHDFMRDKHTRKGRALGRGEEHFYNECIVLNPLKEGCQEEALDRIKKLLEMEKSR